jgi:azurin
MKTKQILYSTLLLLILSTGLKAEPGAKTVAISAGDTMKYTVTKIEAAPGQKITVELTNEGNLPKEAMGHNWVLLKAGVATADYASAAITAKAENYQPAAMAEKVIASIPVLGPKETGKVTFTAPSAPGEYHFLCSFPGHSAAGMVGVLVVK